MSRPALRYATPFALALVLQYAAPARASTALTFDIAGGITNFQAVPSDYGERVAGTPQAGHAYGFVDDGLGFTPDVVVTYGSPDELPALWTTGYGDLTGIHFNDQDSDTTFTITLTADPGFDAILFGFDLASFRSEGQTLLGVSVLDGAGGTLFSQGSTFVPGAISGGHTTLDFGPDGLQAHVVRLVIDLTGLGMRSDDIGVDNLVIAQTVPEPRPGLLIGLASACFAAWRRWGA